MDLVDLIQEKRFLGQEFLAWLWYKSEERGGSIEVPGRGDVLVVFEKHMLLEYGEGDASEKVICRGLQTELKEARAGLSLAKKPEQARLRLSWNDGGGGVEFTAKKSGEDRPYGGGNATAVKIDPIGFLVIKEGTVRMVNVTPPASNTVDRIIDLVPQVMDRVDAFIEKQKK